MSEFRRFYRQTYLDQLGVDRRPPSQDPAVLPYWGAPAFRDEFDVVDGRTPSGVNPDKWRVRDGETLNYDQGFITGRKQNVYVANGCLNLVTIRESGVKSLGGVTQPTTKTWTTGYVDTIGKHAAKYGRWDLRAKLNTHPTGTRGVWPAGWLRPSLAAGETADGEIDSMEAWGGEWARTGYRLGSASWTLHESEAATHAKLSNWLTASDNNPDLSAAFHVFTVEWTPTAFRFYVDSTLRDTVSTVDSTKPWLQSSFNAKFHYRIQLQIGQDYWGQPDATTVSPSEPFQVDYLRYYAYPGA